MLDIAIVLIAYTIALSLKFDGDVPGESWRTLAWAGPLIGFAYILSYQALGVYRTAWQYGSLRDAVLLAVGVTVVTAAILMVQVMLPKRPIPLTVNVISAAFILLGHGMVRMLPRMWGTSSEAEPNTRPQAACPDRRRGRHGPDAGLGPAAQPFAALHRGRLRGRRPGAARQTRARHPGRRRALRHPKRDQEVRHRPRCDRAAAGARAGATGGAGANGAGEGAGASGAEPERGHGGPRGPRRDARDHDRGPAGARADGRRRRGLPRHHRGPRSPDHRRGRVHRRRADAPGASNSALRRCTC